MSVQREIEALCSIVLESVPTGSAIRLSFIKAAPRVQRRVAGAETSELLIEAARELRASSGMPFWHALFLTGERTTEGVPSDILRSAMYHQDPTQTETIELVVSPATAKTLSELADDVQGRDAFALLSRVTLPSGEDRFIPMLDFTSKSTRPGSEPTVRAAVEVLDTPGTLFASARSYHFYGRALVSQAEQLAFWARALLLTPIVDERWIAHQMRSQTGALRISPNEKGIVPTPLFETVPTDGAQR